MTLGRQDHRPSRVARLALALCAAFAGLVATPADAAAAHVFVQKRDREISSGASVSVDFGRANKSGNVIVVYVVWDNGGAVSLADTNGNAYVSAVGPTPSGDGSVHAQVFYARDIEGGKNAVTASFATPISAHAALYIHEYTRLGRMVPFDAAVAASGTLADMDSGSVTTRSSSEFLFVGAASNGPSIKRLTRGFKKRTHRGGELTAEGFGPAAGSYQVTASQSGTGWVLQLAAFQYLGPTPASARFPAGVSASGRYLVDQSGDPFLITGDSPQALMVNLSESQANAFFANRQKRGFNTLWVNLLCGTYTGGRGDASTFDGIRPFTNYSNPSNPDLSTPNEEYFSRVDDILRLAAQRGITVLLDPAETGSFSDIIKNQAVGAARGYGRYLGNRYQGFDNIIWMSGNDFEPQNGDDYDAAAEAVALGIQDFDHQHIHTVEVHGSSLDDPTWAPIVQLNASYTYHATYAQVLSDYNRNPLPPNPLPTFLVEANYEFENQAAVPNGTEILRRQAYWALLSGAAGQLYGNKYTWPMVPGWQSHFDTPGAVQMGYVRRLFESLPWYDLVPDQTHMVVTVGFGTFSDLALVGESDYVTAARTPDGSLVVAYLPTMPTEGHITVDMTQLSAPASASWYDPSTGKFSAIAGAPFQNTASHDFTPPGPNRDGDDDWVLVLQAN
jgi:hypothetical protein